MPDVKNIENKYNSIIDTIGNFDKKKTVIKKEEIKNETRVYEQSLRHNIWLKTIDIINVKFPNESDLIKNYRNANIRRFTKEVPRKIIQGIISVITQITIKVNSNNEKFNNWINSEPFIHNNSKYDFYQWSLNHIIPISLIDPNAILLPIPELRGLNNVIGITPVVIDYNKRWIDPAGNYLIVIRDDKKGYYYIDKTEWWDIDLSGQTPVWTLFYQHNLNELPYESLPGLWSFDTESEEKRQYQESIISATYEILDEALMALTSAQATRAKMNPVLMRQSIKCKPCSGTGYVKDSAGGVRGVKCTACGGSGNAKMTGEYEELVINATDITNPDGKIITPSYINPDPSVAEFLEKVHNDLLIQAKKSVGIDALIDKSESGEAMKRRLGTFEEFISYLIYIVYTTHLTKFLEIVHKMLERNTSEWHDFPQIQVPKRIEIKTPEILKENFDKSVGAERLQAAWEYYKSLYADNTIMLRTMKILIDNYPASIENNNDLISLRAASVFSSRDIKKSKQALTVIRNIIESLGVTEKTDDQIFKEAEEILNSLFPDQIDTGVAL